MSDEWFNKGETIIGGDNIHKSKERYAAIQRVRHGQGSADDHRLVESVDRDMKRILQERKR